MKRVGILTLYHGSMNFGGVLQACALCRVLDQLEIPNEQIRCIYAEEEEKRELGQTLKKLLNPKVVWRRIQYELNGWRSERQKSGRREAFARFNEKHVPSSGRVYTSANIRECLTEYSAFVTGSDQVWNPDWYCPTLFLDFVPEGTTKLAYAASLGKSSLTEEQKGKFREHLKDFTAVSVREMDAVDIVQPLSPVTVECVLDPTLLLTGEQWGEFCADRLVDGDYLFYYFLGEDANEAELVQAFARKHGLKIIGIPSAARDFSKKERISYDQMIWDASPAEFLSLIRHASYVFTDSFHATVFSCVFRREHFTFPRAGHSGMTSRIQRVASLFETLDHFCDTPDKASLEHIAQLAPIDYTRELSELEQMRKFSMDYLKQHLSGGKALDSAK